jgi:hypothetical protein
VSVGTSVGYSEGTSVGYEVKVGSLVGVSEGGVVDVVLVGEGPLETASQKVSYPDITSPYSVPEQASRRHTSPFLLTV